MKRIIASVVEVAGALAITVGAFTMQPAAGWIIGGAFAIWAARSVG
jgi:hypothetical protein